MTWPRPQIRYLARMGTGHTPSRSHPEYWEDCTVPWLTLADVHQLRDGTRTVVHDTSEKISLEGIRNSSAVPHPAGTVAMSRTASVGFTCIMGTTMATSQDFVTWTCGDRLDNRFLLWALRGERAQILSRMQGSTHKTIYMPDLEDLRISLPPLAEQRAIVDYLDAETSRMDALIAKKQGLIDLLELQFLQRCRAMTTPVDAPIAPLRWTTAVRTGTTPSAEASWMMSDDGSVEWFTPGDVGERLTLHPSARRLDPVALSSREVPAFPAQSTLLVGIGATAGKVAFMSRAGSSNQQMTAVVPGAQLQPRFLAWQLWARGSEMRATAPYTTLPILNNDFVKSFQIRVPTLEAQNEIVDCVDRLDQLTTALIRKLGRQTRLLAEHRQELITSTVAGSLSVAKSKQRELTGSR